MLYVHSNSRGTRRNRRDDRKREREEYRRREEGEELKISHLDMYTRGELGATTALASACRTSCNLPPCYSRAHAKLINGKVEVCVRRSKRAAHICIVARALFSRLHSFRFTPSQRTRYENSRDGYSKENFQYCVPLILAYVQLTIKK